MSKSIAPAQELPKEWFESRENGGVEPTQELMNRILISVNWPSNSLTYGDGIKKGDLHYDYTHDLFPNIISEVMEHQTVYADLLAKQFAGQTVYKSLIHDAQGLRPWTIDEDIQSKQKRLATLYQTIGLADGPATAKRMVEKLSENILAALTQITGLQPASLGRA